MAGKLTLDVFADYYTLQAILSDRRAGDHPDLVGGARNELARISAPLANCFSDYMFLICMGEARHAVGSSGLWCWGEIPKDDGRVGAYRFAEEYNPIKTLPQLADLFEQPGWGGSYGGKKWKHIAEVALQYRKGELSAPTFVDHVADLKHNGGTQFSKGEVEHVIQFKPIWSSSTYGLTNFLTFKRDTADYFAGVGLSYFQTLSLPVGRLAIQYMQRIRLDPPHWSARPAIEYEPFSFGEKELKNRSEKSKSSYDDSPKPSSAKKAEKLDDSMYLSEDEMYDPAEAKHDPKVSGPGNGGEPVGGQPKPEPSKPEPSKPEPVIKPTEKIEVAKEKGEAQDEPSTTAFTDWLLHASGQLS